MGMEIINLRKNATYEKVMVEKILIVIPALCRAEGFPMGESLDVQ